MSTSRNKGVKAGKPLKTTTTNAKGQKVKVKQLGAGDAMFGLLNALTGGKAPKGLMIGPAAKTALGGSRRGAVPGNGIQAVVIKKNNDKKGGGNVLNTVGGALNTGPIHRTKPNRASAAAIKAREDAAKAGVAPPGAGGVSAGGGTSGGSNNSGGTNSDDGLTAAERRRRRGRQSLIIQLLSGIAK